MTEALFAEQQILMLILKYDKILTPSDSAWVGFAD